MAMRLAPQYCCPGPWAMPADVKVVTIGSRRYFESPTIDQMRKIHAEGCADG